MIRPVHRDTPWTREEDDLLRKLAGSVTASGAGQQRHRLFGGYSLQLMGSFGLQEFCGHALTSPPQRRFQ
jgi:hypothetical protein